MQQAVAFCCHLGQTAFLLTHHLLPARLAFTMDASDDTQPLVPVKQEVLGEKQQAKPNLDLDSHLQRGEEPLDWDALRERSLEPGGFGADRAWLWPRLLHADSVQGNYGTEVGTERVDVEVEVEEENMEETEKEHEDERQIGLDTDRSFVLYPVGDSRPPSVRNPLLTTSLPLPLLFAPAEQENPTDRTQRQHALHALIVQVFRRHPGLSYFQGYHDIITVLLLTLPPHAQLRAAERLSLHRLRDSMGRTLEPLVGLLRYVREHYITSIIFFSTYAYGRAISGRVLQRLLHLADPAYAALLEEQAPLPYPALSHLLTLFAHDVPTLPLAQHIFDYLFARPPIAVVYLAAAVMLARKDEVVRLEEEGDEGMIHSVLTGLPELLDREEGAIETPPPPPPPGDEHEHGKMELGEDVVAAPAPTSESEPREQDGVDVVKGEEEAAFVLGVDEKLKLEEGVTVAQGDAVDDDVPSSDSTPLSPPLEEMEPAPTVEQAIATPETSAVSNNPDNAPPAPIPVPATELADSGVVDAPPADAREPSP
ncbi:hypothetical protein EVG20_g5909, partial [Dentipellis fragilis]